MPKCPTNSPQIEVNLGNFLNSQKFCYIVRVSDIWTGFEEKKNLIPDDLILMPGVIDTTTNFVEHQNLVVQRLKNFTNIVGNERVIGSSDCGFGTFAGFGTIDPDIAYEKLKVLAEGAAKV